MHNLVKYNTTSEGPQHTHLQGTKFPSRITLMNLWTDSGLK